MTFYAYDRGDLVVTTERLELAVAAALAIGPGASVSNDSHLLLVLYAERDHPFDRATLDAYTEVAYTELKKSFSDRPDIIPIFRSRPGAAYEE